MVMCLKRLWRLADGSEKDQSLPRRSNIYGCGTPEIMSNVLQAGSRVWCKADDFDAVPFRCDL